MTRRLVRGGTWARESWADPEIAARIIPSARALWLAAARREDP